MVDGAEITRLTDEKSEDATVEQPDGSEPTDTLAIVSVPMLSPAEDAIEEAVRRLRRGGLLGLPTETVYGLAADARNDTAVRRIFDVKGRPADHPLIVHIHTIDRVSAWAIDIPGWALTLADACWPGPLTLVVHRAPGVSDVVTGGLATVGLRVPDHPAALAVLESFEGLAAPSANRFGSVSPTTADHVLCDLGNRLDPERDAILDGGSCRVGLESTIVDATDATDTRPVILRPGAVTATEIEAITGVTVSGTPSAHVRAPGMLAAHYAPRVEIVVIELGQSSEVRAFERTGYFGASDAPPGVVSLSAPRPYVAELIAPILYETFRRADDLGLDRLVIERPRASGIGDAVIDRLMKAATGSRRAPR